MEDELFHSAEQARSFEDNVRALLLFYCSSHLLVRRSYPLHNRAAELLHFIEHEPKWSKG